jgi:MFS family permease
MLTREPIKNSPRFFMLISICIGVFISHFTAGIVNVSLPQFEKIFQTSSGTVQWITTGYLLVIASFLPIMGKLGDRYSYRLIHKLGYIVFTISSVLVAFSPNITVLLILRLAQAVGAAMFQSTNIALITIHIPKENRGRALGIVSTAVALGAMTGPIAAFRLIFQINVLLCIGVMVMLVCNVYFDIRRNRNANKNDAI